MYLRFFICLIVNVSLWSSFNVNVSCTVSDQIDTIEPIRLRLESGELLIGNRKVILNEHRNGTHIVYEFLGLPFAEAPFGNKRFQFPHNLTKIFPGNEYNATFHRPACVQGFDHLLPESTVWNPPGEWVSEDCLHMNIWVPVHEAEDKVLKHESEQASVNYVVNGLVKQDSMKATLFWLYGGSFSMGTASIELYDGTFLAGYEKTIVVSSNYRLGPFGFLYLNSSDAPGNAGLADQVKALEWYRDYYLDFIGGSNRKICLFGESAGAMAAHDLLISEKNYLFDRIILQSASTYSDLTYREPEDAFRLSKDFANQVGCLPNNTNSTNADFGSKILECLLKLDAVLLSDNQWLSWVNPYLPMAFIPTADYHQLIKSNPEKFDFKADRTINHEVLVGSNQDEGSFFLFYQYYSTFLDENKFYTDKNGSRYLFNNLFAKNRLTQSVRTKTFREADLTCEAKYLEDNWYDKFVNCLDDVYSMNGKLVSSTYPTANTNDFNLDSEENKNKNSAELAWKKVTKVMGDMSFTCPIIKFADMYGENKLKKTFLYRFNQRAKSNTLPKWLGVMHGYEIEYIFGRPWSHPANYDQADRLVSRNMMSYWANFARFGKLYSEFDRQYEEYGREYFVDLTAVYLNGTTTTEATELEQYNKLNINCGLWNKFNHEDSYETKYQHCVEFRMSIKESGASQITPQFSFVTLLAIFVMFKFF